MRDKLIELIGNAPYGNRLFGKCFFPDTIEGIADHLISNGVTFAECLVDTNKTSPMTNGDYLRSLDNEGLAVALNTMAKGLLAGFELHTAAEGDYRDIFLYFLKRPAEKS